MWLRKCGVITIFTGNKNTIIFNSESRGRILCENLFFVAEWRHTAVRHSCQQTEFCCCKSGTVMIFKPKKHGDIYFSEYHSVWGFISCGGMEIQRSEVCSLKAIFYSGSYNYNVGLF